MSFLPSTNESLHRFIPGYAGLPPVEKKRINEFFLVWQIFEGNLLNFNANGQAIQNNNWFGQHATQICQVASSSITFFRQRYVSAADAQERFNHLIAGRQGNGLRNCIELGLGEEATSEERVRACGAVCYRLRNNLFHGGKAAYGFEGQRDNFTHGVRFLNTCLHVLA